MSSTFKKEDSATWDEKNVAVSSSKKYKSPHVTTHYPALRQPAGWNGLTFYCTHMVDPLRMKPTRLTQPGFANSTWITVEKDLSYMCHRKLKKSITSQGFQFIFSERAIGTKYAISGAKKWLLKNRHFYAEMKQNFVTFTPLLILIFLSYFT